MDMNHVLKFLVIGGLIAFILLLVSFQFLFAVIVLMIALVSYIFLQKSSA